MKQCKTLVLEFSFFLTAFLLVFQISSYAQLKGNYTIDPTASASSTNYRNWASAADDMLFGTRTDGGTPQGSGVSGAVTFTVYDTVYANTKFKLFAVSGASASNTITFRSKGGDSSKCVLQYPSGTSSTDDYVLMLDGADYINFENIGFLRTGTNAYYTVVQLLSDADYNKISNCWIETKKEPSNTTTGWTTGVGALVYLSGNGDYNVFSNNRFVNGYNGIYTTTSCSGIEITDNVFDTIGCIGVYMTSQTDLEIKGNQFNMADFGSGSGHYISYAVRLESSSRAVITHNKMYMRANNCQVVRGIVFVSISGSSSAPSLVNNNWILNSGGTSSCTCISLYGINYLDLYYNNFLITNALSTGAVVHHNTTYTNTYVDARNNNFINKGGGRIYDFPGSNGGLNNVTNNNCFATGSTFGVMNGTSYSSLSAWQSGTSLDASSLSLDPGYVSTLDLHVSNIGINGKAVPYSNVTDDIDGDIRNSSTPDIGADEFFPTSVDIGISSLDSPAVFCAGTKNVMVSFQNFGINTITSTDIKWEVNGKAQTPYSWTGSVNPGSASSSIILGNYTFLSNVAYELKIWTDNPNSSTDGNHKNDTLTKTIYAGMTGDYYIGVSSSADFKSFNNAISAMTERGICDSITFHVYDGTYNEQITLGQLSGMGASNPVVFRSISGDSSKVVVTLPSSTATGNNNACIQLTGADYVTFRGITFERTGSNSISQVLHILNESNHNTFEHCQMINITVTSLNATGINVWSDQSQDNYNVFRNNYIRSGTYNIFYEGLSNGRESGTVVEGNVFSNAYADAVHFAYNDGIVFRGNTFKNSNTYVASSFDLELENCNKDIKVEGNYFYNNNSDVALQLVGCSGNSSQNGFIANNFIAKEQAKGMYIDGVDYQNIVFNNINFYGSGTSNAGIYTTTNSSSNIVIKNNNIVMSEGYALYIASSSQISASDRNNLVAYGSQFVSWGGALYSTISALKTGSGKDANSISTDPKYISTTDLHITNYNIKGLGESITEVPTDIDGETRKSPGPDIGADEISEYRLNAGIYKLTGPKNYSCEGVSTVQVIVKNYGTDTLKSATIGWSIEGVVQTQYLWTGSLAKLEEDTVDIGSYNFIDNVWLSVYAWTSNPNNSTDEFIYDDTMRTYRYMEARPVADAGTDAGLCIGDSVQIGPSPKTHINYTWMDLSGNVVGSAANIYVKPTVDQSYVVEFEHKTTGCTDLDTMDVFVHPLPVSGFTVNKKNQCLDQNNFVFTNTTTGAITHYWEFGNGDTAWSASPSESYASAQAYDVILSSTSSYGCVDTSSAIVYVRPHPESKFSIPVNKQCLSGNLFSFSNLTTGATSSFWDFNDGATDTATAPTHSYMTSGEYRVGLTSSTAYGCLDSSFKKLTVYPQPEASFAINDTSQCFNDHEFIFSNTSTISDGDLSYDWDLGDGTTGIDTILTHSYASVGSYDIWLRVTSLLNCKDSFMSSVTVKPHPVVDLGANDTIVNEETVTLKAGSGFDEYLWSTGDQTENITIDSLTYGIGDFEFWVRVLKDGCDDYDTIQVTIERFVNGINELDPVAFELYPNPVHTVLNIEFGDLQDETIISILDVSGRSLKTIKLKPSNSNRLTKIDVSDFANGVYYIQFSQTKGRQLTKFIKY